MLGLVMPQVVTVAVDVVVQGLFHAGTGYAAHRLRDERLRRDVTSAPRLNVVA